MFQVHDAPNNSFGIIVVFLNFSPVNLSTMTSCTPACTTPGTGDGAKFQPGISHASLEILTWKKRCILLAWYFTSSPGIFSFGAKMARIFGFNLVHSVVKTQERSVASVAGVQEKREKCARMRRGSKQTMTCRRRRRRLGAAGMQPSLKDHWHTYPFKLTRKRALNEKMPGSAVHIGWL